MSTVDMFNQEELITEMLNRQNRASNIIIFNINGSKQKTRAKRNTEHINTERYPKGY